MNSLKNEHIILSKGLNLSEILEMLKKVKKDKFLVYLPENMEILYNPINLKLFIEELKSDLKKKKITFFSTDSHLISLFKAEGLDAETSAPLDIPLIENVDKDNMKDFFSFETKNEFDVDIEDKEVQKTNITNIKKLSNRNIKHLKKFIIALLIFSLFISGASLLYFPKASIILYPKTTLLSAEKQFVFNTDKDSLTEAQIYLESRKIESEVSLEFEATGLGENQGTKAQGEVLLKNETNNNQTLVEQTRLISEDKKIYRLPRSITIPANGEVRSIMIAENVGMEYNIQEGKLLIPGFEKEEEKYSKIYALLENPINNGSFEGAKIVTEQDISQAKLQLKEILAKDLNEQALKTKEEGFNILDIGSTLTDIVYTLEVEPGTQTDKFSIKAKSSLDSLLYISKEVENIVKNDISQKLEKGKTIMPNISISFSISDQLESNGLINSIAYIDYKVINIIDKENVGVNLRYKNRSFVEDFLNTNYDLESYNLNITPSFLPIMPIFEKNIIVTIGEINQ